MYSAFMGFGPRVEEIDQIIKITKAFIVLLVLAGFVIYRMLKSSFFRKKFSNLSLNMTSDEVLAVVGKPRQKIKKVRKDKEREVWKYGKFKGKSYRVTLENDIVVSLDN